MEKPNEITPTDEYYYVYDPGYLEKKCIEKLSDIVTEYQTTMDTNSELRELRKQIETLNKKCNNGGMNDAC